MKIGIVGHEAKKFTPHTEAMAKELIKQLLEPEGSVLVSGHCHLGGIDIWAEEAAQLMGRYDPDLIFAPKTYSWSEGYKPRNIKIAENADILHNIIVAQYPPNYDGMRFDECYHCGTNEHIKSGGCWTARYAQDLGKVAHWHVLEVGDA